MFLYYKEIYQIVKRIHIKKILILILVSILALGIVVILFISPITKYLIEKYDEKYTGRQIKVGWAYINPFTGYIHLNKVKTYEAKSDSVFFSAEGLSINFSLYKLFAKTYEINSLSIEQPWVGIIQNKDGFNFDDLKNKFSSEKPTEPIKPLHLNILNIKITNGKVSYHETVIPINYSIEQINFESAGKQWNIDTIACKISFLPGIGNGYVKSDFSINVNNHNYSLKAVADKFDIALMAQYLKELSDYGSIRAKANANIYAG